MIQPNELRLLNWVKYDNRYFQIHSIAYVFPTLNTDEFGIGVVDYNNIQPVELTPDILEAAGFGVNKDNSFGYINENEGILIELGDFYEDDGRAVFYYNLPDTDNSTCIAYCKYLHQLQNLYYCLTGEELQIDITKLNKENE